MTTDQDKKEAGKAVNVAKQQGKASRFRTQSNNPPHMDTLFRRIDKRTRPGSPPLSRQELRGVIEAEDTAFYGSQAQLDFINFCLNYGVMRQEDDRSFTFDVVQATVVRNAVRKGQALPYVRTVKLIVQEENEATDPVPDTLDVDADSSAVAGDSPTSVTESVPDPVVPPVVPSVRKTRLAYLNRVGSDALEALVTCVELGVFKDRFPVTLNNAEFCATRLGTFFAQSVDAFLSCADSFVTAGILTETKMTNADTTEWRAFTIIGDLRDVKVVVVEEFFTVRVPEIVLKTASELRSDPSKLPTTVTDLDTFLKDVGWKFYGRLRRYGKTPDALKVANDYGLKYCSWNPNKPEDGWGFLDIADDNTVLHCLPGLEAVTLESDGTPMSVNQGKKVEEPVVESVEEPVEEPVDPVVEKIVESREALELLEQGATLVIIDLSDEELEAAIVAAKETVMLLESAKTHRRVRAEAKAKIEEEAKAKAQAEAEAREAERIRVRDERRLELEAGIAVVEALEAAKRVAVDRIAQEQMALNAEAERVAKAHAEAKAEAERLRAELASLEE